MQRCLYTPYVHFYRAFRARVSACTRNINIPFSCRSIFAPDGHNDGKSRNLQYAFPGETCSVRISLSSLTYITPSFILVFQRHYHRLVFPQSYRALQRLPVVKSTYLFETLAVNKSFVKLRIPFRTICWQVRGHAWILSFNKSFKSKDSRKSLFE